MKTLIIFLSLFSLQALAAEESTSTEMKSYRYPSELSDQEYEKLFQYRQKYDQCLHKEAKANLNKYDDARKVADTAITSCSKALDEINGEMAKMKLDPDYIRFFLHKISQKSIQQLLPELMATKAGG